MLNADETLDSNLNGLTNFLKAYSDPIRAAVASLRFVRDQDVDDVFQSFILKVQQNDLLGNYREKKKAGKVGSFRGWLFRSLRNHAVDWYRRAPTGFEGPSSLFDSLDRRQNVEDYAATEDELLYALSMLHLATQHVRRHWQDHAKPELWASFEEVYLQGQIPRLAPAPDPGAEDQPGARILKGKLRQQVYNQATTVLRVFRRVLPEVIPAGLCDRRTAEERYAEWCSILVQTQAIRNLPVWLAFLEAPHPSPDAPTGRSEDLAMAPGGVERDDPVDHGERSESSRAEAEAVVRPKFEVDAEREWREAEWDELRVLLAFWLAMPFRDYLDDLDGVDPGVTMSGLSLRGLLGDDGTGSPSGVELEALLRRVKSFAKQVYQLVREGAAPSRGPEAPRRLHSMPAEVAQVLYNLAIALALTRCGVRIDSLPRETVRMNFIWVSSRPWLIRELCPVFTDALRRIHPSAPVPPRP